MTGASIIPRRIIILAIVLPLATMMGYLLATPEDFRTVGMVGVVVGLISIPLILRWHHPVLIFSWNCGLVVSLLPGSPTLWMLMSLVGMTMVIINTGMDRRVKLTNVKSLTWILLALVVVIVVTAQFRGGMGVRALGGASYGGKKYFILLFAILGYFAISLQRITREKADTYSGLYVLSKLTLIPSNLAFFVPALWFLYYFLPTDYAMNQVLEGVVGYSNETSGGRFSGVGFGLMACTSYMLLRYGVRGILDLQRWWRILLYLAFMATSLIGGFRSILLAQLLLFFVLFTLEGFWRTRWAVVVVVFALFAFGLLALTASYLPASFQRSLSFLPVDISPVVRMDAQFSSEWRLRMWKVLLAEIPNYFWLGKGYVANANEYFLLHEAAQRGLADSFELSVLAGDYHSGPLSVIIPLGIWGVIVVSGFFVMAWRVLRNNYRFGHPELIHINRFFLAAFVADLLFFVFVFGDLTADFHRFAGYAALSIALNGGMSKVEEV